MADYGRSVAHWLLLSLVIGGLWLYADARRRSNSPAIATWKDCNGVLITGNPYAPPDPPAAFVAVAKADLTDEIQP